MQARPAMFDAVWHHGRPGKVTDQWPGADNVTVRYDGTVNFSVPWRELEVPPATSPDEPMPSFAPGRSRHTGGSDASKKRHTQEQTPHGP
jgi:hypothetical protein